MTGRAPLAFALAVAVVAVGWRAADVRDWPAGPHPTVEYESALAARSLWLAACPSARTPERQAWLAETGTTHVLSPPVLPGLVAVVSAASGEERPESSRLFAALFWLAAGVMVGLAAGRLTGRRWAAAASFAWFVLCPFGMAMSRSFQTEPVLAFGFAAAVWHLARPGRSLAWRETLTAGLVCGTAALVKPGVVVLPLFAGFAAVVLPRSVAGSRGRKARHVAAFAALLVAPGAVYVAVMMGAQTGGRVMPHLLAERWFYENTAGMMWKAVGPALAVGLAGAWVAARSGQYLPLALFAGHLSYAGVFTFHAATHDYYHVPLLVVAGVALGGPAARLADAVARRKPNRVAAAAVLAWAVAAYLLLTASAPDETSNRPQQVVQAAAVRQAIGRTRVIELTPHHGYPLRFDGWVAARSWPRAGDRRFLAASGRPLPPADDLLAEWSEEGWRYFVVTDFAEWELLPDLRAALSRRGREVPAAAGVRIFDLRPEE